MTDSLHTSRAGARVRILGVKHGSQALPLVSDPESPFWSDDEDIQGALRYQRRVRGLMDSGAVLAAWEEDGSGNTISGSGMRTILQKEAGGLQPAFLPELTTGDASALRLPDDLRDEELTAEERATKHEARERLWADAIKQHVRSLRHGSEAVVVVGPNHAQQPAARLNGLGIDTTCESP